LRVDPATPALAVRQRATEKLADIERKIEELVRMKRALEEITHLCTGQGPVSQCPILDALDEPDK